MYIALFWAMTLNFWVPPSGVKIDFKSIFCLFLGSVPASIHDFVSLWVSEFVSLSTKNYDSGYDHWYRHNQFMCTHKTNSAYNTVRIRTVISAWVSTLQWHRTTRNREGIMAWVSTLQLNVSTVYSIHNVLNNGQHPLVRATRNIIKDVDELGELVLYIR